MLRPLQEPVLDAALAALLPSLAAGERAQLARLSGGSIGAALALAEGDGAALAEEAARLVDDARAPDIPALLALGERLWRVRDGLAQFGAFLVESLAARIRAKARAGAAGLEGWTEASSRLEQSFARAAALNLEPRQTLLSAARVLAAAAGRAGPL
jgi:DNA polymerase-3 subunit delta'